MRKQWNSTLSFYWYDQHGRRVAKQENGLLTLYIWDGMDIIATAHADGTIREYYTRGIGIAGDVGSLIAETRFESNAAVSTTYLHSNWRGDVVMATDTSGNVVGEYAYTTFGEQLSSVGDFVPRFTFSSKERDASGLVYHGFRYYSPVLCRWISEDPIREFGGINLYQFCGNDPINGVDAYGLLTWAEAKQTMADTIESVTRYKQAKQIASEMLDAHPGVDDMGDARRHAEWSRRMTSEIGRGRAWLYGTGWEIKGWFEEGDLEATMMDLENNATGRRAGAKCREIKDDELVWLNSPEDRHAPYYTRRVNSVKRRANSILGKMRSLGF